MLDLAVAGQLKHVDLPHQVGTDVSLRVNQRISNTCLGAEVNNPVETVRCRKGLKLVLVTEIDTLEAEGIAVRGH
jgi:hypothetical protein